VVIQDRYLASCHVEESASRCQRIKTSLPLYFPRFNEPSSDRDEIMFTMAFFALFIATFSLASPLGRQTSLCPWNGITNADNFTLLAVFKTDNGTREPLALGSNGLPNPSSLAWLGVFMLLFLRKDSANMPFMMMQSAESINPIIAKYFVLTDGEITAYGPDGSLVGVSNQVANNSGQLSFFRPDNGATGHSAKAYCELVSFINSPPSRDWSHSK
jgi:hypothetical protein